MKGYMIIPGPGKGDVVEVVGYRARERAIKRGKELIAEEQDEQLMITQFDDDNADGYTNQLEILYADDIMGL